MHATPLNHNGPRPLVCRLTFLVDVPATGAMPVSFKKGEQRLGLYIGANATRYVIAWTEKGTYYLFWIDMSDVELEFAPL